VKLEHAVEPKYGRLGEPEEHAYWDSSLSEPILRTFMSHFYDNFQLFYGSIRGWVFREKFEELQYILESFVVRYQEVYRLDQKLDALSYLMPDIRLIPLDVNTTLKFSYFRTVLQSYNANIAHLCIFAHGVLAYSSLRKNTTLLLAHYLFSAREPYFFAEQARNRLTLLPELPKHTQSEKFGLIYDTKVLGFDENSEAYRLTVAPPKPQGNDLLGLEADQPPFELFELYIEEEEMPVRVGFYA
jgi:hypothetical protein